MLANKIMGTTSAAADVNYIEDVFSTYLYTGTGATQTITNGIDLAGEGGLVWFKPRNTANNHNLIDSARGLNKFLITNNSAANGTTGAGYGVSSFNSDGFSLAPPWTSSTNTTDTTQASWTFRKQPKFFDVQTFTSNGSGGATVSHSLGSTPGFVIVKNTGASGGWAVWHRSMLSTSYYTELQTTNAQSNLGATWLTPSSTNIVFDAGALLSANANYVMYVFAHDAGGFGLSGNENVVSCGSFEGNATVDLGWEPQFVLFKRTDSTGNWRIQDNMRGFFGEYDARVLYPNLSNAEGEFGGGIRIPSATGFTTYGLEGTTIYIAIRRGPMKVPTDGTKVFAPVLYSGNNGSQSITAGFPVDMEMVGIRNSTYNGWEQGIGDRLRGSGRILSTAFTDAEKNWSADIPTEFQSSTGTNRTSIYMNFGGLNFVDWMFRRAPGFMDVVCYTGSAIESGQNVTHNLKVAPELVIVKRRDTASDIAWWVGTNFTSTQADILRLNQTNAKSASGTYTENNIFRAATTSTTFTVGSYPDVGASGGTFVAYLFATCAGVSKVGSYTGTGTTQAINCGFTAGARFVLIKRTDSTGDWYVWDSARGIVSGNDPYLLLNSTAAEVTGTDYIDPSSAGFEISSTAPAAINASGGSYIFLAVA